MIREQQVIVKGTNVSNEIISNSGEKEMKKRFEKRMQSYAEKFNKKNR